jgi:hypothetical protein
LPPREWRLPGDPAHRERVVPVDTTSIREKTPEVPAREATQEECAGCRREFSEKDLITVHEGRHHNLHFFAGGRICKSCARANGVEF